MQSKKSLFAKTLRKDMPAWLLMLPGLILFAFFLWQPLVSGIILSFFRTKGFKALNFTGLQNYADVIRDAGFISALKNSFMYTIWSIILGYALPIIIAIVINELVHFKPFFKFSIYFPNMVPGIAVYMMWQFMYDPGKGGLFNTLLSKVGLPPFLWLQNTHFTVPLIVVTMVWRGFGPTALIFLASLQNINKELYEASTIDGAGIWKRLTQITIPGIYNMMRLILALQIISVFQVFYEPLVMTDGGPNNASTSLILESYKYAFSDFQAGKAIAASVIVFIILIILTSFYFKLTKEQEMN